MRTALIVLNLLVATASVGLLGYTFFARDHLTGLAEDYVIEKTVHHTTPAVDEVEAALKNPLARFAPGEIRDTVQAEVDAFRRDPSAYVRALVAKGTAIEKVEHPFAKQMVRWKESVQGYFDQTLASLIRDLRIFSGTNVVAALLAAWLASRARGQWRWHVLGLSILLLFSLCLHAYMFIDNLTFFHIITNMRVGWSYPLFMALTFAYLYVKFGRFVPLAPPEANPPSTQKPAAVG